RPYYEMLVAAYGNTIPLPDLRPVIFLLGMLHMSSNAIAELIARFFGHDYAHWLNEVYGVRGGSDPADHVTHAERERVRRVLAAHGYDSMRSDVVRSWIEHTPPLNRDDARIPVELRPIWFALADAFPHGPEDMREYIVILDVLRGAGLADDTIVSLMTV